MLERELQKECDRINGAQEMLGLLRERLQMQRDELGPESAQEAMDEMLTQVLAMQSEYQRRLQAIHPHHKSYLFFLSEAEVIPIRHDCYIPLVEGKAVADEFAGQTLRLADWYVRVDNEVPQKVVNETYSWLVFDEFGRLDLHAAQAIETSPLPSADERIQIETRQFESELGCHSKATCF